MDGLRHIAFIMDGNGRWAKKRLLPRKMGHKEGVKAMKRVIKACNDRGIEAVSFYAFSTENWSRPKDEISALFEMVDKFAREELEDYAKEGYVVRIMGDVGKLPKKTADALTKIVERTRNNNGMYVNIGLNYGGRDEIARACKRLAESGEEITADNIASYLDTVGLCDPDIIVRSAGEQRLSNFMLWQSAYSELMYRKEYWPTFDEKTIDGIIEEYNKRERRFGAV